MGAGRLAGGKGGGLAAGGLVPLLLPGLGVWLAHLLPRVGGLTLKSVNAPPKFKSGDKILNQIKFLLALKILMPPSSSLPTSPPPQINISAPPSLLRFSYPLSVSETIKKKGKGHF